MSFTKALGNLVQAAAQTAVLPFSLARDICTLGGVVLDEPSATVERIDKIAEELRSAYDELDK